MAHRALSSDPDVGLFLPCNVTIAEEGGDIDIVVTAIDPIVMLSMMKDNPVLNEVAQEARAKLKRVIESLSR